MDKSKSRSTKKEHHSDEDDPDLQRDFVEMASTKGFKVEEHYVQTIDGYILGMHRILPKNGKENNKISKGVVFMQHGFLQNSEAWIAPGPNRALPYILSRNGYDVWLGNNRGNKYSYKHVSFSPNQDEFWDFCIDELAWHDLPAMIGYVLETTGAQKLSYVGFSQGTAQAFAAFSTNMELAAKIKIFIALAPASRVNALHNPIVAALTTSRPNLIFLLFGKRELLGQTLF